MRKSFEISTILNAFEQKPFYRLAVQEFFIEWCKINAFLTPKFLPRERWNLLDNQQILQQKKEELFLYLPQDLQLWEMMEIIRKIDHNTFKNKSEKHDKRADQLYELGKFFEKTGLYLANYFSKEEDSKEVKLAQDLAQQFYSYWCSLQQKTKKSGAFPKEISLSEQELSEIDQRLLGKEAYAKRVARLWRLPSKEQLDSMRKKLLSMLFKALTREDNKEQGECPQELKKGPYYQLQEKVQEQLMRVIQTPETELYSAIFRRGKRKLCDEMPAPSNIEWYINNKCEKLLDVIKINQLKSELEYVRNLENTTLISTKELEIAKKIQQVVSSFKYEDMANIPSNMVQNWEINCLGAVILGGTLLDEFNINYLVVDLLGHVSTILITSDDRRYRQDFAPRRTPYSNNYTEITCDMLQSIEEWEKIKNDKKGRIKFKNWKPYEHVVDNIHIANPEKQIQSQMLYNQGNVLYNKKDYLKSVISYQKAIDFNPHDVGVYYNLGLTFKTLGMYQDSISVYKKFIQFAGKEYQHRVNIAEERIIELEQAGKVKSE